MISLLYALASCVRYYLRQSMPTNIMLDTLRTRRRLKWGVPAMLLAVPYLSAAYLFTVMIDNGAPGWVHLFVVLCVWNSLKFCWNGVISVVCLCRAWTTDRRQGKCMRIKDPAAASSADM